MQMISSFHFTGMILHVIYQEKKIRVSLRMEKNAPRSKTCIIDLCDSPMPLLHNHDLYKIFLEAASKVQ